jgi:predicted small secreted protein
VIGPNCSSISVTIGFERCFAARLYSTHCQTTAACGTFPGQGKDSRETGEANPRNAGLGTTNVAGNGVMKIAATLSSGGQKVSRETIRRMLVRAKTDTV